MRKMHNGECNVRNFRRFLFGMSSYVPAFKVRVLKSAFRFWSKFELECLLLIFIYSNSKFKVTFQNEDFEYLKIHTKEKPSKVSNITFAISHFSHKDILNKVSSLVLWSLLLLMKPSGLL